MAWVFCKLLPNFSIRTPIESADFAIVGIDDSRIKDRVRDDDDVVSYAKKFKNVHGSTVKTSTLLFRKKNKQHRPWERAFNQFRNIVSACVIARSFALSIFHSSAQGILSSDYFAFFPYFPKSPSRSAYLVSESWHNQNAGDHIHFIGQPNPNLPHKQLSPLIHLDKALFEELDHFRFKSWREKKDLWRERLFRSVEVAYSASIAPFETIASIFTLGSRLVLWVSAFEILANTQDRSKLYQNTLKLLTFPRPLDPALDKKRYRSENRRCEGMELNAYQKIYERLYFARNAFGHGNPVNPKTLSLHANNSYSSLFYLAPILYALALYKHLDIADRIPAGYLDALKKVV